MITSFEQAWSKILECRHDLRDATPEATAAITVDDLRKVLRAAFAMGESCGRTRSLMAVGELGPPADDVPIIDDKPHGEAG